MKTSNASSLYEVQTKNPTAYGEWPVYLIDLHGARFQMGYDYGYLLGTDIADAWNRLLHSLLGDSFFDQILIDVVQDAVDWQVAIHSFSLTYKN